MICNLRYGREKGFELCLLQFCSCSNKDRKKLHPQLQIAKPKTSINDIITQEQNSRTCATTITESCCDQQSGS